MKRGFKRFPAIMVVMGLVTAVALTIGVYRFGNESIAPLFLNSRLDRLGEKDLPKILVEKGDIIYCRMKADDFRFPLPPGTHMANPVLSGGFDTVDGTIEALIDGPTRIRSDEYETSLSNQLQAGARVSARPISGGLLIEFHYFGDR